MAYPAGYWVEFIRSTSTGSLIPSATGNNIWMRTSDGLPLEQQYYNRTNNRWGTTLTDQDEPDYITIVTANATWRARKSGEAWLPSDDGIAIRSIVWPSNGIYRFFENVTDAIAPTLAITPDISTLAESGTQRFTVSPTGGTYDTITYAWTLRGSGSLDTTTGTTVLYTPADVSANTPITLTVTSTARGTGTNAVDRSSDTSTTTESFTVTPVLLPVAVAPTYRLTITGTIQRINSVLTAQVQFTSEQLTRGLYDTLGRQVDIGGYTVGISQEVFVSADVSRFTPIGRTGTLTLVATARGTGTEARLGSTDVSTVSAEFDTGFWEPFFHGGNAIHPDTHDLFIGEQQIRVLAIGGSIIYNQSVDPRDISKNIFLGVGSFHAAVSDGTTLWFVDSRNNTAEAYNASTRARDSAKDISLGTGIWDCAVSDGTTLWFVENDFLNTAVAYNASTRARDSVKDIDLGTGDWVAAAYAHSALFFVNGDTNIALTYNTDGTRFRMRGVFNNFQINLGTGNWIAAVAYNYSSGRPSSPLAFINDITNQVRVYNTFTFNRARRLDFNLGLGLWECAVSDGTTVWFIDNEHDTAHAYSVSRLINAA